MEELYMNLKSCRICKKLFKTVNENDDVCPACRVSSEETFQLIKQYLQEYPGTALPILSEETGVPIYVIEHYLKQERIEVSPNSPIMLCCNKCGAQIVTGMYCDACGRTLANELKKIKNAILAEEKERSEVGLKYVAAKWHSKE